MSQHVGIGINGMGRIGRLILRRMLQEENIANTLSTIRAINTLYPAETIAHLIRYDSVHGKSNLHIEAEERKLRINGHEIAVTYERDIAAIDWRSLGVEMVIDATGQFVTREGANQHLQRGADKVIVTAPGKNLDLTVVMGVNERDYDPYRHQLISTASCTTNCVAPVLSILDQAIGIEGGWITSVHAYTGDQRLLDNPHTDLRRARACVQSIVPTSTGIGKALKDVLPHLAPVIKGLAVRVPVQDISLADMTLTFQREVNKEMIREAFLSSDKFKRYIDFNEAPLVSVDYIGSPYSAIIDGLSLQTEGKQAKILAWYDNEWGYACRVVDMAQLIAAQKNQTTKVGSR